MKMSHFFIPLLSVLLFACNSTEAPQKETVIKEPTPVVQQTEQTIQFEAIPKDIMEGFWKEATGVEGTVYSNGASFSLWDKNSVQQFITLFETETPTAKPSKQVGHIMLVKDGNQLALFNVYELNGKAFARLDQDGKSYYSILKGQASNMFLNLEIKPKE